MTDNWTDWAFGHRVFYNKPAEEPHPTVHLGLATGTVVTVQLRPKGSNLSPVSAHGLRVNKYGSVYLGTAVSLPYGWPKLTRRRRQGGHENSAENSVDYEVRWCVENELPLTTPLPDYQIVQKAFIGEREFVSADEAQRWVNARKLIEHDWQADGDALADWLVAHRERLVELLS